MKGFFDTVIKAAPAFLVLAVIDKKLGFSSKIDDMLSMKGGAPTAPSK